MLSDAMENVKAQFQEVKLKYKKLQQLRSEVHELEKQCGKAVDKVEQALKEEKETFNTSKESTDEFKTMSTKLHDMASTLPQPPTFILRMIIGDINVTLNNNDSRLLYKQEYEKFKMANTTIIMILCVISLFLYKWMLPSALVHLASVWYYSSVTLRELVLKTNGSRIKWWWLLHHYCSIFIAAIFLMWPPGPCYDLFKPQFMLFSFVLSCVMALQFRYQRAKMYRDVAMGHSHRMAISQESQIATVFDFTFLVVCLCCVYLFQFFNSYTLLMYAYRNPDCHYWQVFVLSIMFFGVGLLNFLTLLSVLYSKTKRNLSKKTS